MNVDRQRVYDHLRTVVSDHHFEITKMYPRDMRAGNAPLASIVEAIRLDLESLQDFRRGSPLRQRAFALIAASSGDLEALHAARMRAAAAAAVDATAIGAAAAAAVDIAAIERRIYARRLWRAHTRA
jgi:hypothetical protein